MSNIRTEYTKPLTRKGSAVQKYKLLKQWKPIHIEGLEHYEVSNYGEVRNTQTGNLLKLHNNWKGYPMVHLRNGDITRTVAVHRLVARAFIPNPDNLPTVDHIDNVKDNNVVTNLQWMTVSQNVQKAFDLDGRKYHGKPMLKGEAHGQAKFTQEDIDDMRLFHAKGVRQTDIARIYGISKTYVWSIVHGQYWKLTKENN